LDIQEKIKLYLFGKGGAEDEINDSVPKLAKLRPMRVEMHLWVYDRDLRGFRNLASLYHTPINALQRTAGTLLVRRRYSPS